MKLNILNSQQLAFLQVNLCNWSEFAEGVCYIKKSLVAVRWLSRFENILWSLQQYFWHRHIFKSFGDCIVVFGKSLNNHFFCLDKLLAVVMYYVSTEQH